MFPTKILSYLIIGSSFILTQAISIGSTTESPQYSIENGRVELHYGNTTRVYNYSVGEYVRLFPLTNHSLELLPINYSLTAPIVTAIQPAFNSNIGDSIVVIRCDASPDYDPSAVFTQVLAINPKAIVLSSNHKSTNNLKCHFNTDSASTSLSNVTSYWTTMGSYNGQKLFDVSQSDVPQYAVLSQIQNQAPQPYDGYNFGGPGIIVVPTVVGSVVLFVCVPACCVCVRKRRRKAKKARETVNRSLPAQSEKPDGIENHEPQRPVLAS